jgi:hypothetical protein
MHVAALWLSRGTNGDKRARPRRKTVTVTVVHVNIAV